ncbi:MAG: tetratricopeptide repeat protein [Pyrinomonadaceae bacterium]
MNRFSFHYSLFRIRFWTVLLLMFSSVSSIAAQSPSPPALTINTEPNTNVWIDEVRRGTTDGSGRLVLQKLSAGRHILRLRAIGYKESTTSLLPRQRRSISVKLVPTTDQAELLFQQAEAAREQAKDDQQRQAAVEIYQQSLKLRAAQAAAHVGLARLYMDLSEFENALREIDAARRIRPVYPEASAVEGRINREAAFTGEAIKSFRRAMREGRGFQPEAHVGLARVFEDKGEFNDAVVEYRKAIDQLSDSEPVIYQLLGAVYEKLQEPKEAVAAYEKYLQLAPNGSYAGAVRSILQQLKREAAGEDIIP